MSTLTPDSLRTSLNNLIDKLTSDKIKYIKNPQDYSRTRKLSFKTVITSILQMSGGSINHELLTYFNSSKNTPSASAFVQQRSKILPDAFEALFNSFSKINNPHKTYKNYRVLAVDGSDLHILTNSLDTDSYFAKVNNQRPYNLLHLNAFYDVCCRIYTDTIIQKSRVSNENQALIDMVNRDNTITPTLIIADRGYESYNALAHIQEKGWNFLFRIKDANSRGGIANGLILPDDDEYDIFILIIL